MENVVGDEIIEMLQVQGCIPLKSVAYVTRLLSPLSSTAALQSGCLGRTQLSCRVWAFSLN